MLPSTVLIPGASSSVAVRCRSGSLPSYPACRAYRAARAAGRFAS